MQPDHGSNDDVFRPDSDETGVFGGRGQYLVMVFLGLLLLVGHHLLAVFLNRVHGEAVVAGVPIFLVGVCGTFFPRLFGLPQNPDRSLWDDIRSRPLSENIAGGAVALAGVGLGFWLLFGYYLAG